jgi:predicted metal-binding membrane protein
VDTPAIERLIRRDRAFLLSSLTLICALAWLWVIAGAGMGMTALEMTRIGFFPHLGHPLRPMQMGTPLASAGLPYFLLMVSMWWIMMIAMMLPSAAPAMLLYARTLRYAQRKGRMDEGPISITLFLLGYLAIWLGFSILATGLQMLLVSAGTLSEMMLWSNGPALSATILFIAAAYQLTPLKQTCLHHCQSPAEWLSLHWIKGDWGAFQMGLHHGTYCVGCCWALMLLLFVGGVMNLIWIAALAILVLIEKLELPGFRTGQLSAALLILWAIATLLV